MKCGRIGAAVGWVVVLAVALTAAGAAATEPPQGEDEPPRILALLEHAWAAESGRGDAFDPRLALALYCRAGSAGSPEGYFRVGLLLVDGPRDIRDVVKGRGYLSLAAQLGHERAARLLEALPAADRTDDDCEALEEAPRSRRFEQRRYTGKSMRGRFGAHCRHAPGGKIRALAV